METHGKTNGADAASVVQNARRLAGGWIKEASFVRTPRGEVLTVLQLAERVLRHGKSVEEAGRFIAERFQAGVIELTAAPKASRSERIAAYADAMKQRVPNKIQAIQALDMLHNRDRIHAVTDGKEKVSPVRDPKTGKIDVLATAKKYGLSMPAQDADEERAARFDAGDYAAKLAFGKVA